MGEERKPRVREVDRGSLGVRPWGRVLADLARRDFTGSVCIEANDRHYEIAFASGLVIDAHSQLPADAAARIAVKHQMVPAAQASTVAQAVVRARESRRRSARGIDEIEIIERAARLSAQEAMQLRRHVLVQRAARTFELESGVFVVREAAPPDVRCEVEVHEVVYVGARLFAPLLRLTEELRGLGVRFQLEAGDALVRRFAFGDECGPVLAALRAGTSLAELDAEHRDLDLRTVHAIVYALVTCGAARASQEPLARRHPEGSPLARAGLAAGTRDRRPFVAPASTTPRTRSETTRQDMFVPRPRLPAPPLARAPTLPAPSSTGPDLGRAPTQTATRARRASSDGSEPDGSP